MDDQKRAAWLFVAIGLAGVVFLLDLLTPLEIEVWVLYLPVVLLPLKLRDPAPALSTVAGCSVLVIGRVFLIPTGTAMAWDVVNRLLGTGVMWLAVLWGLSEQKRAREQAAAREALRSSEEALRRLNAELEQRVAERTAETRHQQERLLTILNTTPNAIITIDQSGMIETVNPAADQMFGYAAGEMVGRPVTILMPEPGAEQPEERPATDFAPCSREVVARRKDGSTFDAEWTASAANRMGLIAIVIRDISRRKELEREVVEIATWEQQRIGQDLHDDCGQELTALGLLTDTLIDSLQEKAPADCAVAVKIEQGIKRVLRCIRSISRGLVQSQVGAADLGVALTELTSRLGETSGVRCTFFEDEEVVIADDLQATHLYHIAQEACTNALKHGEVGSIQIHLRATEAATILTVQDDGVGLPEQLREGLGFSDLRNRASVIGAHLTIERASPRGTLVACTLPREHNDVTEPGIG